MLALPLSIVFMAGCFTPESGPVAFTELPFENEFTQSLTIMMRPFTYDDLLCPDGEPATFYAVYRTDVTTPMPLVLVFHSGAMDYVRLPKPEDPLIGDHYKSEGRMTAEWAGDKVFETFSLITGDAIDPAEVNDGALPAALADAGAFAIYPANCWGDLWHNEDGYSPNDWSADGGIHRQGRFLAWAMTRFASGDGATAADWRGRFGLDEIGVPIDSSGLYMVGLGDGGRAIAEVIVRGDDATNNDLPEIKGVILDSTPDNLDYYIVNQAGNEAYYTGLERIYGADAATSLAAYSLGNWYGRSTPAYGIQVFWSSNDPQVPDETLATLVSRASALPKMTVEDTRESEHIYLNAGGDRIVSARGAVTQMLTPTP